MTLIKNKQTKLKWFILIGNKYVHVKYTIWLCFFPNYLANLQQNTVSNEWWSKVIIRMY